MRYFNWLIILLFISTGINAQTDYTGQYGYSFKPKGEMPENEKLTAPVGRLTLLKMDKNKYRFWLDVNGGAPSYNLGESDGTVTVVNDTGSFNNTYIGATAECIFHFHFSPENITIKRGQNPSDCGFGHEIYADGEYYRLNKQAILNYDWLKTQYNQSPSMTITAKKAILYLDENCLYPQKDFFTREMRLLNITETEKSVYTEYITPGGDFKYGWLKKTDVDLGKAH